MVDLADVADKRLGEFSGGMQRRVDLAASLVHLPAVVFLDEPTEGLDPRGRATIWDALDRLRRISASRSSSPPTTWTRPTGCAIGGDHRSRQHRR